MVFVETVVHVRDASGVSVCLYCPSIIEREGF